MAVDIICIDMKREREKQRNREESKTNDDMFYI